MIRDTLFVKTSYQVILRTECEDFTGEFVMHCHILEHEDRGMMQNVEIVSPTTAFLRQMATPVKLASSKAEQWFAQLVGAKSANAQEVFASSLCTAKGASVQAFTTR
ncbi:multicopper oxidase, type 3 [Caballeronia terrestris]|uniref:Multicopper oxidase, type 3 n=1 Tax=Caballeronia terrestris TaxID=1226301 RepID=A0A158ILK2_9BURK|nr:multicopper oxidase domain-containing protein [Caballeronia terrestris]SAL56920.1 multicopper oxidase, type 3 [Caballeronia terrestris]